MEFVMDGGKSKPAPAPGMSLCDNSFRWPSAAEAALMLRELRPD
jgi:hypothetical protein